MPEKKEKAAPAPKKEKAAPKQASGAPAIRKDKPVSERGYKRNADKKKINRRSLGSGLYKRGRKKLNVWTFVGKKVKKTKPKKKLVVVKPIGGEKNGETRKVSLVKRPNYYPTHHKIRKRPARGYFKDHKRSLKPALTPGKIVILLGGVHKGGRAVFLKQLKDGSLLIDGPFCLNGIPLRPVQQSYVITTSTSVDVSGINIPDNIDVKFFKRIRARRPKQKDGDIFVAKKEAPKMPEQRKAEQKRIDKELIQALRKTQDSVLLRKYLCTKFALRSNMYPHKINF